MCHAPEQRVVRSATGRPGEQLTVGGLQQTDDGARGGIGPGSILMRVDEIRHRVWAGVDGLACVGRKSGSTITIGHGNDGGIDGHRSTQVYLGRMRCRAIDNRDGYPAQIRRRQVGQAVADLKVNPGLGSRACGAGVGETVAVSAVAGGFVGFMFVDAMPPRAPLLEQAASMVTADRAYNT